MRRDWVFALVVGMLALAGARAAAAEPAPTSPYAVLATMDTQARASWVQEMLGRLDEANRVVLAPSAVAGQHARFARLLGGFVENRDDWQARVTSFEAELALSQRAAVEHLARRYRMEVYQAFRTDRATYDQRRQLLERLLADWRNCSSPGTQRHKVIRWLIAATGPSVDSALGPVPPLPDFEHDAAIAPAKRVTAQSEPPRLPTREPEPPRLSPRGIEPPRVDQVAPPLSAARAAPPPTSPDVDLTQSSVSPRAEVPLPGPHPAAFLAKRTAVLPGLDVVRPAVFQTPADVELPLEVRRSAPRPHHVAMRPSFEPLGFAAVLQPTTVASSEAAWRRPSSVAVVSRPLSTTRPQIASRWTSSMPGRSGDPLAFARTRVERLTMVSTAGRSMPASHPSSLESLQTGHGVMESTALAGDGLGDRGLSPHSQTAGRSSPVSSNVDSLVSLDRDASARGDFSGGGGLGQQPSGSPPSAMPNMEELAARIRGNNMAMRKLAAELYEDRNWDARSLGAVLDQLAPLMARKDDLKLIRDLIPPRQRDRVGDLESGSDLISDLGSKIAQARSKVEQSQSQGNPDQRKAELDQLDQLSRKLANLVFNNR